MVLFIEIPEKPHKDTVSLMNELLLVLPDSEIFDSKKHEINENYHLKIHEDIGPQFLIFNIFSNQYVFKIIDYRSRASMGITSNIKKENHQLVLSNFLTDLGMQIAEFFMLIFPINLESNQVVNFTVKKDFIYFRMYRCSITEKKTLFEKIGPHLTLRLWRTTKIEEGKKIIGNYKKYIKNANLL